MSEEVVIYHPLTGEVIEHLDRQPAELLAEALALLRERSAEFKKMDRALDEELRRRLQVRGRKLLVFGGWEVELDRRWSREWDADELEFVLRDLIDRGSVLPGEVTELIKHETVVNGREAQRLLARLTGDALKAVESCFRWQAKEGGRTKVVRSVELVPADPNWPAPGTNAPEPEETSA